MNINTHSYASRIMRLDEFLTHQNDFVTISDDVEYQLVTVKLHGKGIIPREKLYGAQIKTKKQQVIRHNQFLVAEIDAKVGAFGVVPQELDGAIVSGHYFLYDINSEIVVPEFLDCFVASGFLTEKIQEYVQGSLNYAAIRPTNILEIEMVVPIEKDDQRRVVNQLSEIRRVHQAIDRQIEAVNALEKNLMRQVFGVHNQ